MVIIDITKGRNEVIGEMDRPSAKELIFKNAVYIHRGRQYLVENLDIENRKCLVREADVNYFTDGVVKTDIKVLTEDETFSCGNAGDVPAPGRDAPVPQNAGLPSLNGVLGDILVRSQAVKFKKIRFHTHENIGYGDIDVPEEEIQTRSLMLLFDERTAGGRVLSSMDEALTGSVLSGTGNLIRHIAPMYLLCDPRDLGCTARVRDPHFGTPCLYIYDKYPGGTGLAEALVQRLDELFNSVYRAVRDCPCEKGCPSCVGPEADKPGAAEFLKVLAAENF